GGTPTGLVFNSTKSFAVTANGNSAPSVFLFVTEDGTILGWNPTVSPTNAVIAVNSGSSAVYKGLAIASSSAGDRLYATNFKAGVVEIYDTNFKLVSTFTDPKVDPNFAPFGIQNINGEIFVTFAMQILPEKKDDQAGPGNGFVDVFDTDGNLLRRFPSHGTLNSPWSLAKAPPGFGHLRGHSTRGN